MRRDARGGRRGTGGADRRCGTGCVRRRPRYWSPSTNPGLRPARRAIRNSDDLTRVRCRASGPLGSASTEQHRRSSDGPKTASSPSSMGASHVRSTSARSGSGRSFGGHESRPRRTRSVDRRRQRRTSRSTAVRDPESSSDTEIAPRRVEIGVAAKKRKARGATLVINHITRYQIEPGRRHEVAVAVARRYEGRRGHFGASASPESGPTAAGVDSRIAAVRRGLAACEGGRSIRGRRYPRSLSEPADRLEARLFGLLCALAGTGLLELLTGVLDPVFGGCAGV